MGNCGAVSHAVHVRLQLNWPAAGDGHRLGQAKLEPFPNLKNPSGAIIPIYQLMHISE